MKHLWVILLLMLGACKGTNKITETTNATGPVFTPIPSPINPAMLPAEGIAKNVIFLIGDGMGLSQISAGNYWLDNHTALEDFPVVGLHKCHSSSHLVTDSAAGATAFACGVKTFNGAIGVGPDSVAVETILEEAESLGYATGLVATSTIVHATPASFIAHNEYRKNYEAIAADFLQTEVDYFVGGGKKYFDRREDGRDLIIELEGKDYTIYDQLTEFKDCELPSSGNFGYFSADADPLPFDAGRDYLVDASETGWTFLNAQDEKGFFLMIEGSQIDWGGHANVPGYVLTEFAEFDQVIAKALQWALADGETLVVVTADHETGGLAIREDSTMDSLNIEFISTKHTAAMIPVFAYGPGSENFSGIYENTEIYNKLRKAMGFTTE